MKKTRTLLAAAAAIAGLVALAGPAQAVPPQAQHTLIPLDGTNTAGVNGYCAFPVEIDYLSNQKGKDTSGPPGSTATHFTGFASATVTNLATNKTLTFNVSGPGTFTDLDSLPGGAFTLDVMGHNLLWTTVANSFPGVPQLAFSTGHVQVSVDDAGLTTTYELNGKATDVCKLLAS
jgi:hypothetical protein